jgi:hypothetical protein
MKARLTIIARYQPNTFQMLPRYHAESRVPTNLNVAKIFGYGDNIENRIDGQSLLADQGRLLAPFRTTPMLISPKNQAHLFIS